MVLLSGIFFGIKKIFKVISFVSFLHLFIKFSVLRFSVKMNGNGGVCLCVKGL